MMDVRREYHRFPKRERCTDCNARRWYLENGRKYCENGHQVEGYVQFDVDLEDNFGKAGKTIRKKKVAKEKESKHLSGSEARVLYLVCLQIILRKQVAWLVRNRGFDRKLESVCRGLWDLRIRKFIGLGAAAGKKAEKGKGKNAASSGSDGELVMYSSQAETQAATTDEEEGFGTRPKRMSRVRNWSSENWDLPGAMDTLAVVYLGCLLRKETVRIGDVFRWAQNNQLPFLGAIDLVPPELRERLPGWGHRSLLTRYATFKGSELHQMVMTLMLGYQKNYGVIFPKMPSARLLLLYVKELALPPHVHKATQELCARLDLEFSFPTRKSRNDGLLSTGSEEITRHTLLDIPDALLVAALVVATKYMYPFDRIERFPRDADDPLTLKMDWAVWEGEFAQRDNTSLGRLDFEKLDPQKIWAMTKEEVDDYLTWYQETRVNKYQTRHGETDIEQLLFPLQGPKTRHEDLLNLELSEEQVIARMKRVQRAMGNIKPRPVPADEEDVDNLRRIGSLHQMFRTPEDLVGPAKRFYEKVAEISGLSLRDLVHAVFSLENMFVKLQARERKEKREGA